MFFLEYPDKLIIDIHSYNEYIILYFDIHVHVHSNDQTFTDDHSNYLCQLRQVLCLKRFLWSSCLLISSKKVGL